MDKLHTFAREIIDGVLSGKIKDRQQLQTAKLKLCSRYKFDDIPQNSFILSCATPEERETVEPFLVKKPVRTISGVAVVAVMTSPHPCPHGKCIFCPSGASDF